jgi:hypothetical protein
MLQRRPRRNHRIYTRPRDAIERTAPAGMTRTRDLVPRIDQKARYASGD